jgi:hypothetical protein
MKHNFVKGIAPAENLRYLVQVCGTNIILTEQAWIWWNSVGRSRTDVDFEQRTGHQNIPSWMKIRPVQVPFLKGSVTLSWSTSTDKWTFRSVLLPLLTVVNWITPAHWFSKVTQHVDSNSPCRARDTGHALQRVSQELDYRIDICRVTKGAHIEHLQGRTKTGVSIPLLTCSPSAWPSRLLYRRGRKSRRDLWITLYITNSTAVWRVIVTNSVT